jgi:hypothetical protein
MYKTDVREIVNYVKTAGPDGLAHVAYCVIGSIRTRFIHLETITESIKREGQASKHVWGHKNDAYKAINLNKDKWFDCLVKTKMGEASAIDMIAETKGIGLAKSGFLLQMLGYNTACLDVHNLNKLGIAESYFKKKNKTEEYVNLVQKEGSEYWWNTWCNFIAEKDGVKHFSSGKEVSKSHVTAIKG